MPEGMHGEPTHWTRWGSDTEVIISDPNLTQKCEFHIRFLVSLATYLSICMGGDKYEAAVRVEEKMWEERTEFL